MRPKLLRLPVDPVARVRMIAERSVPDPDRPRLSEENERKLEDVERRSAVCYAESEELTHQLRVLASEIAGCDESTDVGSEPRGDVRAERR